VPITAFSDVYTSISQDVKQGWGGQN